MLERNNSYKRIGDKLIQNDADLEDLKLYGVRVVYLSSDIEKRGNHQIKFADCRKVDKHYSWCCKYDFIITIYEPNIIDFDKKQLEILIKHELLHCGIDTEGNEPSFYVAPHDVEEFYAIINEYGTEWARRETNAKR